MAQDPFVNQIERVGTDAGLALPEAALVFDGAVFAIDDQPTTIATGSKGESITGVSRLRYLGPGSGWTQSRAAGTSSSTFASSTTFALPLIPIPVGGSIVNVTLIASIPALSTLNLEGSFTRYYFAARPSSGSTTVATGAVTGSTPGCLSLAPFASGNIAVSVSGSNLAVTAGIGSIPAWQANTAYTAGPIGVAQNIVNNDSGKLYVCTTAGTSANSGGPTGTGSSINDNGTIWAFIGTTLSIAWTAYIDQKAG